MVIVPSRSLQSYVEEYRSGGAEVFRQRYTRPVLVREASSPDFDDDDRAYHTGFISPSELRRLTHPPGPLEQGRGPDSAESGSPLESEVYVIAKREGAPFPERIGVGRAPNADVSVPVSGISKYHAFFTREEDSYCITDAGSSNGTSVDDHVLEPKQPSPLSDGARVRIGPYVFRFYTPDGFEALVAGAAQQP